jgi:hypothetical protein
MVSPSVQNENRSRECGRTRARRSAGPELVPEARDRCPSPGCGHLHHGGRQVRSPPWYTPRPPVIHPGIPVTHPRGLPRARGSHVDHWRDGHGARDRSPARPRVSPGPGRRSRPARPVPKWAHPRSVARGEPKPWDRSTSRNPPGEDCIVRHDEIGGGLRRRRPSTCGNKVTERAEGAECRGARTSGRRRRGARRARPQAASPFTHDLPIHRLFDPDPPWSPLEEVADELEADQAYRQWQRTGRAPP